MVEIACDEHNSEPGVVHVVADPWEGTRSFVVDFPTVRDRFKQLLHSEFSDDDLLVLYLCGSDHFKRCGLSRWNNCVAVARPGAEAGAETDAARHIYIINGPGRRAVMCRSKFDGNQKKKGYGREF